ncbi:MAG: hypothetical protein Q9227_007945 [Pyrenula ochraceoflavens]
MRRPLGLMDMPGEIRNLIYDEVLAQDECIRKSARHPRIQLGRPRSSCCTRDCFHTNINIIYVSRRVYRESLPRHYAKNSFYLGEPALSHLNHCLKSPYLWNNIRDLAFQEIELEHLFNVRPIIVGEIVQPAINEAKFLWNTLSNHLPNLRILRFGFTEDDPLGDLALWLLGKLTQFYILELRKPVRINVDMWSPKHPNALWSKPNTHSHARRVLAGQTPPMLPMIWYGGAEPINREYETQYETGFDYRYEEAADLRFPESVEEIYIGGWTIERTEYVVAPPNIRAVDEYELLDGSWRFVPGKKMHQNESADRSLCYYSWESRWD